MKKTSILLSAALMFFGLIAKAQTTITFDAEDYKAIGVYDMWEESPFRTGELEGNAGIANNPSTIEDEVLGVAPNSTGKVVAFQRSRYASNAYGVRIDLKEPIRVTKQLQYIHVMTYLKDKPTASRMMVIGLGKRLEDSWNWQTGEEEQFWSLTSTSVEPKDGWQDIVVSFKGFSYSKEQNANSGIDIYSLVIVPDVRTPQADAEDWVAYFDEIVVDNNPNKRFSTEQYALTYDKETSASRNDRVLNKVGLTVGDKTYESAARSKKYYSNNTTTSVFSAKAGDQVQPTFGYTGGWMSAYVYTDWGCDALFKDALNADGTPAEGSDVVSYNAYEINGTWYKSDGTTTGNGNTIGAGVPKFTVPAGTAPGFYRMRYKVDWNSIDPAGATEIISNGGGIVDVMLDVHGDKVTVNASQLNGDIVLASDESPLQNYVTNYEQPLTVKIVPAPGFVQYGFTLKYGYNVNANEQLDDKGNPNWIEVNVPYTAIAADGTYTIPAEYMRGSQVSIKGDMQQVQQYTVEVEGLEGQGGVVYANIETLDGGTVNATQFFSVEQVEAIAVEGYTGSVTLNDRVITVTYTLAPDPYREVSSLSELKNYKLYQIKAKSGEGYLAWNTNITDTYLSLRGVTATGTNLPNNLPGNTDVANIYKEAVNPLDKTVVWQIISEDGKYYLYHPARNAYVTRDGRNYQFTETKTALDAIHVNDDGSFAFHAGGGYSESSTNFACITTNESETAVRNWKATDHGSKMQIIENPNVYTLEYTVEVVGADDGGITFEGTDYAHGAVVESTEFLTAADVAAKDLSMKQGVVTVDKENAKITVTYAYVLKTGYCYTLRCMATDNHGKFIKDDGTSINGRSSEGSYFVFEPATEPNSYYIKSAVSGKYINHKKRNEAVTVDDEKKTAWVLDAPSHSPGWVSFEAGTTKDYLNNNYTTGAPYLKAQNHGGGPASDNACSLWQLEEFKVEEVLTQWKESVLPYIGYVGGYAADLRDDIEAMQNLTEMYAFQAAHAVLAIDAATYYRLVCVKPKPGNNGNASYNTLTFDGNGNLVTRPTAANDWNQLFRFEAAGNDKYYLRNINANAYLNKINQGNYRSAVVELDNACKVNVLPYEGTVIQWRFHNSESDNAKHCLFAENHPNETVPYACSGWENGANSASAWYIVPVTDFAHTLTVGEAGWASLVLGFNAAIPAEVAAYVVSSVEGGYAQLTEVEGVLPANTAVLINAEAGDYEFAYSADAPATVAANELKGTLYNKNVEGAAYALGVKNDVVALYTVNLDQAGKTAFINYAYKVYLPKNTAAESISLRIEGTTGIENSEISNQNSAFIYDLMGRRVEKMVKGVYIVNGKKVVIK